MGGDLDFVENNCGMFTIAMIEFTVKSLKPIIVQVVKN
jgi:hypothetical protein